MGHKRERIIPLNKFRKHMIALELSCHGLVWLVGCFICLYLSSNRSMVEVIVNLILGLCVDIVAVAVIKAIARRRRPCENQEDMFLVVQMDKYSFPSGHASRVTYLALFFSALHVGLLASILLWAWAACLCASRVLLRRHHVLDVAMGVLLGYSEYLLCWLLWMDTNTANTFVTWLTGLRAEDTGSLEMD